jgi:UDP-glucose 4-epimerase
MKAPNVLITGGCGFIGSYVVAGMLREWSVEQIVVLDDYSAGSKDRQVEDSRVTYVTGSTNDIEALIGRRYGTFTHIFHLGEFSRIVLSFPRIEDCFHSNIDGTWRVLEFAREHGAKVIYAGSSSTFGNEGADANLSPYAFTKAMNCQMIRNYGDWFGLDYVITYFYNVYGPGHIRTGDYSTVIGIFEQQKLDGRPLTVVAPGTQTRDFTHVEDVARGVLLAGERGQGDGYMLGAGIPVTILEVAEMFGGPYELVPERKGERLGGFADTAKSRDELGWVATRSLRDHISEFMAQLENGLSPAEA